MVIEMGSNQFLAQIVNGVLHLEIIEGPALNATFEILKGQKIMIGRKASNTINFPDDQHLSNIHSSIFSMENKYFV